MKDRDFGSDLANEGHVVLDDDNGMSAGLGGALFVPQVGIINPSEMAPEKSLEAVVWCAVGGRHTLIGPIIGAISVNALKSYATWAFPEQWLYLLGGMFILVVLFMPNGIAGIPRQLLDLKNRFFRKREESPMPISASPGLEPVGKE